MHFRLVVQRTEVDNRAWTSPSPTSSTHTDASSQTTGSPRRKSSLLQWQRESEELRRQNNDFGWAHQPFSFLKENTVFLILTAMLKNFYVFLLEGSTRPWRMSSPTSASKIPDFICHRAGEMDQDRGRPVLNLYTKGTTSLYSLPFRQDIFDSLSPLAGWGILCSHCNKSAKTSKLYSILRPRTDKN